MTDTGQPSLDDKVAYLSRPDTYGLGNEDVIRRETHMSWVFLAGKRVYKLKKPVRFPYLDYATLARRKSACRAELRLNRRLSPDVYLAVKPLVCRDGALSIGGEGEIVDWLVVMRRLDERGTLEHAIIEQRLGGDQVARIADRLSRFYRHARRALLSPARHLADRRRALAHNRQVLLHSGLTVPAGLARRVDRIQRNFLERHGDLIVERVRARRIVDGHGDLRPEHVWLDGSVRIIDCLEFDANLRAVDPFDEIAFLGLECERLGAAWVGRRLRARVGRALRDAPSEALYRFYRSHRAMLRARLAIAHLLEPDPATPEKWRALARTYLQLAEADALRLERALRTRAGRRSRLLRAGGGSPRPAAAPPARHPPFGGPGRAAAGRPARCR